jgi:hypothetical protein
MEVDSELYISVEPNSYKENKANLLVSQTHLLKGLRHIYTIQTLAKQKIEAKKKLQALLKEIEIEIETIESELPHPKIAKPEVKVIAKKEEIAKIPQKKITEKEDSLEKELQEIQEKLSKLNSI